MAMCLCLYPLHILVYFGVLASDQRDLSRSWWVWLGGTPNNFYKMFLRPCSSRSKRSSCLVIGVCPLCQNDAVYAHFSSFLLSTFWVPRIFLWIRAYRWQDSVDRQLSSVRRWLLAFLFEVVLSHPLLRHQTAVHLPSFQATRESLPPGRSGSLFWVYFFVGIRCWVLTKVIRCVIFTARAYCDLQSQPLQLHQPSRIGWLWVLLGL